MTETPGWTSPGSPREEGGAGGEPATGAAHGWSQPQPPSTGTGWGADAGGGQPQGWGWGQRRPPDVKPGVVPLRPLGVGEILDGAISGMRAHPSVMIGLAAAVSAVLGLVDLLLSWLIFQELQEFLTSDTVYTEDEVDELFGSVVAASILQAILLFLGVLVLTGMLTYAVGRAVLGQNVGLGEVWRAVRGRLLALIALWFLNMLIFVGVIFAAALVSGLLFATAGGVGGFLGVVTVIGAFICAVWISVRWFSLATPALILERQSLGAAIGRCGRLVRGSWWRVFGILLLGWVIFFFISQIIQTPFAMLGLGTEYFLPSGTIEQVPSFGDLVISEIGVILANTITYPFLASVSALLYIDMRIRREALDLELARAAGVTLPGQQSPGPATGEQPPHPPPGSVGPR